MTDRSDQIELADKLLEATLPHVAFDGWSRTALRRGADDAGLAPLDIERAFPGGVIDAVAHLSDWANRRMLAAAEGEDLEALSIRGRIARLVQLRFTALAPHREAVQAALARLSLPIHQPRANRLLWAAADEIWHKAGDRSTDLNFYTKRGLLAPILASTMLHWLADSSPDYADSWEFLDRGLNGVVAVGKRVGMAGKSLEKAAGMANPVRLFRMIRPASGDAEAA